MTGYLLIAIIIFFSIIGITLAITYYTDKQQDKLKETYNNNYNNSTTEEKTRLEIINQNNKINKINTKVTITLILVAIPYIIALIKIGTIIKILSTITNN